MAQIYTPAEIQNKIDVLQRSVEHSEMLIQRTKDRLKTERENKYSAETIANTENYIRRQEQDLKVLKRKLKAWRFLKTQIRAVPVRNGKGEIYKTDHYATFPNTILGKQREQEAYANNFSSGL